MSVNSVNRRSFLKSTATGIVGATVAGSRMNSVFAAKTATGEWSNKNAIHPDIPNAKVICCYDTLMITDKTAANAAITLSAQHNVINVSRVESNLDDMVKRLTGKGDASAAWSTLFRKADDKQWNKIKVVLKVNCIDPKNMPRVAIVGKVCKELINIGIDASNMTIYDAGHNASGNNKYPPFIGNGIPAGVVVLNGAKASVPQTSISVGSGTMQCATVVVNADILINFAVNKGHSRGGRFTMTMKNHTGTMHFDCPSNQQIIDQNKSSTIIGGSIPKQQLCIIDSIWAEKGGPVSSITHLPCRMVIGTFGLACDVTSARNIREKHMSASHDNNGIATIISGFGYKESDFVWDEFDPSTNTLHRGTSKNSYAITNLHIKGKSFFPIQIDFSSPGKEKIKGIEILDLSGKNVKQLNNAVNKKVFWDGINKSGNILTPGMYVAKIVCENFTESKPFHFINR